MEWGKDLFLSDHDMKTGRGANNGLSDIGPWPPQPVIANPANAVKIGRPSDAGRKLQRCTRRLFALNAKPKASVS